MTLGIYCVQIYLLFPINERWERVFILPLILFNAQSNKPSGILPGRQRALAVKEDGHTAFFLNMVMKH
jgi:hypothetical protein